MWITRQLTPNFRQEYTIDTKILDARSTHIVEIFKSVDFDEVAMINQTHLMLQKYLFIESELLAHLPLCVLPNPKNILLFDSFNLEIAYECLKHDVSVDCVQGDKKSLDSFMSFLPHFHQVMNNSHFKLFSQVIDLDVKKYDVIIADLIASKHQIDGFFRMLGERGILIVRNHHPLLEEDLFIQKVSDCTDFFNIIMPFFPSLSILSDKSYIFASKAFHPLADMLLQKIDLLPQLQYYNAHIHENAFTLPNFLFEKIQHIAKF
ncbi:spermidine synthase [Helicobacter typhlonius]|uniref:Polyamine aminopropyltransferase n=1 Tax=Helicobacter typhlonius TaxID=76936 RepID=A0A099UC04_9HELI|nr:spermidine synthase [Helicobacter typhlonius]TLD79370.1 spermidine synthase [Helicobacter typhlonius]CUU39546.1 Spermidine synthase [Helicobacter typhlonius]HCD72825.1 spermidine synthase [Helicobacter sp.]